MESGRAIHPPVETQGFLTPFCNLVAHPVGFEGSKILGEPKNEVVVNRDGLSLFERALFLAGTSSVRDIAALGVQARRCTIVIKEANRKGNGPEKKGDDAKGRAEVIRRSTMECQGE